MSGLHQIDMMPSSQCDMHQIPEDEPETWGNATVAIMLAVFGLIGFAAGYLAAGL